MNIHEHQAKQILEKYGATVPEGVFALSVDELVEKTKSLNTKKYSDGRSIVRKVILHILRVILQRFTTVITILI